MTDTLKRLSGPTLLTASAATQYTTPAATTTTLRNVHVVNETGTAATFTLSIGTDGAGKRLWWQTSIPANGFLDWSGVVVLAAAEVLQALSGTASALTLTMSGVETVATVAAVASHKTIRRTSGNITVNSTSWINLDTGLDLTLPAAAGDVVEASLSGMWANEATNGLLDVATVVAGSPVTYFSNGTGTPASSGVMTWNGNPNVYVGIGGSAFLVLGAGDISAGTVLVRLRTATGAATNKTMLADTATTFQFTAKNLGPPAP